MDRCALFVDAGYALADGAMAVHGTRRRDSVSWDHAGLLKLLAGLARDRTGLPVLRCYWYETADGRTCEHDALAEMPGLKLRLITSTNGQGKGCESQIRRDLMTLAKSGAISDAFIASANDHLAELVSEVQDLGLRVVVLHIDSDNGWTIPQPLRQECDDIVEVSSVHLRPFVDLIRGAEPSLPQELPQRTASAVTEGDASSAESSVNGVPGPDAAAAAYAAVGNQASPAGRESGAANGAGSGAHHAAHAASVRAAKPYGPRPGELAQDRAGSVAGAAGNGAPRSARRPNGAHAANSGEFAVLPDPAQAGASRSGNSGQFAVPADAAAAGADQPRKSGQFAMLPDAAQSGAGRPRTSGQFPVLSPGTADGDQAGNGHGSNGHAGNGYAPYAPAQAANVQSGNPYARGANGNTANGAGANVAAVDGAVNGGSASRNAASDRPQAAGAATGIYGRQGDNGRSGSPPFATGPQQVVPAPDGTSRSHSAPAGHRAPSVPASYQVPAQPGNPLAGTHSANGGPGVPARGSALNGSTPNGGIAVGDVANSGFATGHLTNGGFVNGGSPNGSVPASQSNDRAQNGVRNGGVTGASVTNGSIPAVGAASSGAAATAPAAGMPTPRFEAAPVPGSVYAAAPNSAAGPVPNRPARQPATGDQAPLPRPPQSFYPAGPAYGGGHAAGREQSIPALQAPGAGPAHSQHAPQRYQPNPYGHQRHYQPQPGPAVPAVRPAQPVAVSLADAVEAAHNEGFSFGESVGRDAPGLWLEAVLARKPRMPSDLEARLLQGSILPIDSLLHDEVRHSLRRGFWDALESAGR